MSGSGAARASCPSVLKLDTAAPPQGGAMPVPWSPPARSHSWTTPWTVSHMTCPRCIDPVHATPSCAEGTPHCALVDQIVHGLATVMRLAHLGSNTGSMDEAILSF